MARLKVVIADCDESYTRRLLEYINSNYISSLMVSCFTKLDSFAGYFENRPPADILIISPDFYDISVEGLDVKLKVILSDGLLKREYPGYQVINKYCTGDKLIGEVLYLYAKTNNQEIRLTSGSKNTELVGIYSPAGGTGKSTIASALAIQCTELGIRSFYLNLESFQSTGMFFSPNNIRNLSYIFYYVKEKSRDLSFKINGIKCTEDGVEYFNPPESPMEYEEINPEELEQLLMGVKGMGCYDYVFVDMYSNLDSKNYKIMNLCDHIILVTLEEPIVNHKRILLANELAKGCNMTKSGIPNKFIEVINKYKGARDEAFGSLRVPEFSRTLVREDGRIFIDDDDFKRAINQIIDIIKGRQGEIHGR